jgi:hypothetical protein
MHAPLSDVKITALPSRATRQTCKVQRLTGEKNRFQAAAIRNRTGEIIAAL